MFEYAHPVHVAVFLAKPPRLGDISRAYTEISYPIRKLLGASKNDQDDVVVGHDEGLGVVDGIEQRLSRHLLVGLKERATNVRKNAGQRVPKVKKC